MDASTIEVLQREPGYLRLRLPLALRTPAAGAAIETGYGAAWPVYCASRC